MVLMGSGMGNANSHTNNDLPILLAGGGFKHGEYKQYPKTPANACRFATCISLCSNNSAWKPTSSARQQAR